MLLLEVTEKNKDKFNKDSPSFFQILCITRNICAFTVSHIFALISVNMAKSSLSLNLTGLKGNISTSLADLLDVPLEKIIPTSV